VAADAAGNFMVFWWDSGQDDCFFCVQGRRFDAAGAPQGDEIRVATDHAGYAEGRPLGAAADGAGNFVVVFPQPGHVRARRFDPSGTPLGAPFQVTHIRDGYQYHPAVAALPGGDFVVVWDWSPWGSHYDVMGRRVTAETTGNCPEQPLSQWDCRQPVVAGKSRLVIKDRTPDRADAITWKWARGEATDLGALGDPLATHAYTLCLYDAAGGRLQATVPAGRTCGTKPCWTALGADGFKYVDRAGTAAGVQKLVLRPGAAAEARVIAKGKGEALDMPALPLTPPVRVQLHAMNGECWETRFEAAGVSTNTTSDFRATGPP
jgi:hypothetical protein